MRCAGLRWFGGEAYSLRHDALHISLAHSSHLLWITRLGNLVHRAGLCLFPGAKRALQSGVVSRNERKSRFYPRHSPL